MGVAVSLSHAPTRLATGAFLLNSGLSKRNADHERAKHLHGVAMDAYPVFGKVDDETFTKALSAGEIALGAALVLPVVPNWVAGLGLTAFSGGLLGLYWRLPGMHKPGSVIPTEDGLALAKDSWMASIGVSLLLAGVSQSMRKGFRRRSRSRSRAKKSAHE